jgi:thiol-disulfide isomerase/thioredoxin
VSRSLLAALLAACLAGAAPAGAADLDRYLRELQLVALPAERPPAFALPKLDGGTTSLASLQGKVVLVYFWATWCGYCRKELPATIERLTRERKDQPFAVLAVNIEEPRDLVAGFVRSAGVSAPVLLDGDGRVTRDYRVRATPTTFVVGRDGRLVAWAAGTRDWDGKAGRAFLDALVAAPAK